MDIYHLLWAIGPDRPGIVAALTEILYEHHANLEDSSMMKLGSEFGVFLIFTTSQNLPGSFLREVKGLSRRLQLTAGFKKINPRLARFSSDLSNRYMVSLHGADRPGLVHAVTRLLARCRFNISDLETHRTFNRRKAGYILLIEGNLPSKSNPKKVSGELARLGRKLKVNLSIKPLESSRL